MQQLGGQKHQSWMSLGANGYEGTFRQVWILFRPKDETVLSVLRSRGILFRAFPTLPWHAKRGCWSWHVLWRYSVRISKWTQSNPVGVHVWQKFARASQRIRILSELDGEARTKRKRLYLCFTRHYRFWSLMINTQHLQLLLEALSRRLSIASIRCSRVFSCPDLNAVITSLKR